MNFSVSITINPITGNGLKAFLYFLKLKENSRINLKVYYVKSCPLFVVTSNVLKIPFKDILRLTAANQKKFYSNVYKDLCHLGRLVNDSNLN